ncbi:MAG TPA: hypothetical protein PKM43_20625, partial [Verrucomicrobiota bacterium]|nr:hypothetical protein [Verrucomicrobiota bacterium]
MKTRHLHFLVTALLLLVTCARPSHAQSGCTITTPTYIGEDNRTYDSCDLVIEGTTVTMDGTHQFNSVTILNYGGLTHSACTVDAVHKLELEVTGTVTVDASSTIDVSGKGYLAGRTKGNTTEGGAEGSAGGSYGGQAGCDANGQCSNRAYGQYWEADEWGSGGGGPGGGTGGGLVRIRAGGMVLNGRVLAYGQNGGGDSGGGSGGGVDIRVTGAFEGAGHIQAFGGGGGSGSSGGRVVVVARERSGHAGVLQAYGAWPAGSAGTVYVRKAGEEYGTLMVDNAGFGPVSGAVEFVNEGPEKLVIGDAVVVKGYGRMLTRGLVEYGHDVSLELGGLWRVEGMGVGVSGSLTFSGRGEVEVVESLAVASEVAMSGGVLRGGRIQAAGMTLANNAVATSFGATTTAVHKLELEVTGTVTVDASSTIDVSGKGYLAGRTKGNTTEGGA